MTRIRAFFHSIRFRIASILFLVIFVFLFTLMVLIRTIVTNNIKTNTIRHINEQQMHMDEGIALILDGISIIYNPLVENPQTLALLDEAVTKEARKTGFENLIQNMGINETIFSDIILYYDGNYYSGMTNETIFFDNEFGKTVQSSSALIVEGPIVSKTNGEKMLLLGKPFRSYPLQGYPGALLFGINVESFKDSLDAIDPAMGYTLLVSDLGLILSHPETKLVGSILLNYDALSRNSSSLSSLSQEKVLLVEQQSVKLKTQYNLDWTIISVLSEDYLFSGIRLLSINNTILALAMGIMALLLSLLVSSGLIRPINNLKERIKTSDIESEIKETEPVFADEIQELEISFNEMMKRIQELMELNAEESESKRKLELYALQVQINPHFLYNTLDAIAWLAKLKQQPEIERLALALARFFRISLHKGDKFITVEEEFQIIKNFIEIELIRFPDKFDIEYVIDPEIKNEQIMKLILQPIVENAIKHGISGMEEKGHISVKARCEGEFIYFEVIDDGLGFEVEKGYTPKYSMSSSGYGIKNVDERIKLEYGEDCGVTVESKPNNGTKVTLKIRKKKMS
ncbi:MAG TPA: histidine kinase [Bacilli bacterium]|jgi:two-component system sensor histidine kinase YesM|nr:histidine kinase [Acholeplasmataceae bacterium]OQB65109.1 MAG: Sensor histidine kinase YehU [Tenericutes bacterium ADurb.Bin140]HOE77146.1 histidine kinase [Bacilli bacterium]HOR96197.1 histidine kinase [Bacilli bacterium]HRS29740.1 histidine kinase [Bacilli bacterium]